MKKEISKQAMDAAKEYIGERIALALWVSPQEKEGLRAMGYDPDKLICIERFNDETVFLPVQYGYPISLAKKDGGGRKDCHTPVAKNGLSIYEKEATRLMADMRNEGNEKKRKGAAVPDRKEQRKNRLYLHRLRGREKRELPPIRLHLFRLKAAYKGRRCG